MKKQRLNRKEEADWLPAWLRYFLIGITVLWLLAIMFGKAGPMRQDFPFFVQFK